MIENTKRDNHLQLLQQRIENAPEGLDVLDASAMDGYLAGVLLQPTPLEPAHWLPAAMGIGPDSPATAFAWGQTELLPLLQLRARELDDAIRRRAWFDPWVFEWQPEEGQSRGDGDGDASDPSAHVSQSVVPWAAGFALALETFDGVDTLADTQAVNEALAPIFAHFDPEDWGDDQGLLDALAAWEPAQSLQEAVEDLVSGCLCLADLTRPQAAAKPRAAPSSSKRAGKASRTRR
jgi:uncharacterized protein